MNKLLFEVKAYFVFLLFTFTLQAQTIHRVTNGMNLQTVIDDATSGDIILVEAGVYSDISINKKLDLYGTGYYLNNSNSAYIGTSTIGSVYFAFGSELSTIQGFITNEVNCGANNITIQRNKIVGYTRIGANGAGQTVQANNVLIRQNLDLRGIYVYTPSINFVIKNNIIFDRLYCDTPGNGLIANNSYISENGSGTGFGIIPSSPNVQYKNNIISKVYEISHPFIFENNILPYNWGDFNNNGNKINVDFSSVFLGFPTNPNNLQEDARYQLAPNSPAKGAGEGGTDCGAFGGDDPYVLSGIPSIPSIYQLIVPANVPQNGLLNVQIKAKTNN